MRRNNETKKKKTFSGLFYNDRFVMLFSVLAAVILWFFVAASDKDSDTGKTVSDIPIQVTLSESAQQDGLNIFYKSVEKASVTVKGNWLTVADINKNDIQVIARQTSTIDQAGTYSLQLTAKPQGIRTNYEIVQESLDPQTITVKVDRLKEKEFTVEDNISYNKPEGYIGVQENINPSKVTVSGPERDVEKIASIGARYKTDDVISEPKSITADLVMYDSDGNEIQKSEMEYVTLSEETVQVDINILKKLEIPVVPTYTNKPAGFKGSDLVTVIPETLAVGCPEKYVNELKEVLLEAIDFSTLKPGSNEIVSKIKLPTGCKNLSNADSARVTIDLDEYSAKEIQVPDTAFSIKGFPDDRTVTSVSKYITVTVVGPTDELETLTEENFLVDINLKDKDAFEGHKEVTVTVSIKGNATCWVYKPNGEDYKAAVNMEAK
ncbi:MAG: hypothetical protein HFE39_04055 [Clostridiales bacterium]|jgi:YbbR domain-containing protein|nr:hypothetical protein [Clostridiales bacterium]